MSVTIRLSKIGRKNAPAYRIVVANTRDKRDGRYLDKIGHYNPSVNPVSFSYDKEKYELWVSRGALVTEAVKDLIAGTYEFKPYKGSKEEAEGDTVEGTDSENPETPEQE